MERTPRTLDRDDLIRMNIPEELWRVKLSGVTEKAVVPLGRFLKGIEDYMNQGTSVLLVGDEGVGKSAISSIIARKARSLSYTVYYTSVWALREARRAGRKFDEEQSVMDRALSVDLLILDDLTEDDADDKYYGFAEIKGLMSLRSSRCKSTILTTKLTGKTSVPIFALKNSVSRLIEFPVVGPNLRRAENDALRNELFQGGGA